MKTKILLIALAIIFTGSSTGTKREADSFSAKNPEKTFVGAPLDPKSINTDNHQFVNIITPEPITLSFSIPVKSQTILPSYDNMMRVVRESVMESGKIKSQQGFKYQLKEIKSYNDISMYFGQAISTEVFWGIPQNATPSKTTAIICLTQEFFSVNMDMPDDGKLYDKDPEITKRIEELVYVSSVSFGRKAMMIVSSEMPYVRLKSAIEEALASDHKTLTSKSRGVLANADVRIMILGNPDLTVRNTDNPFASILEYFHRPVTIDDFGTPIQFTASYFKDNSMYCNKY